MNTLSITATEEGTGKTAIALALGQLAAERGTAVGYIKPKGTRLQSQVGKVLDRDPVLAKELLDLDFDLEDLEPIVYSPTFVENAVRGHENLKELRDRVRTVFDDVSTGRELMLLEGAGKLSTGGIVELTDPEIAELLEARVLLISGFQKLNDLDDLLAAAQSFDDRLAGIVFNGVRDGAIDRLERDAIPYLENRGYPVFGVIPHERTLAGVTVEELAAELGGDRLTNGATDAFIERFLVGAMGADEALRYFRRVRNTAVITGGDRSEIHTAAIEAPGVECLVLTGAHRPSQRILGKAEQADLPVLAVTGDTLSTVERTEAIVRSGRTRDAETVQQMRQLLEDHTDVEGILESATNGLSE